MVDFLKNLFLKNRTRKILSIILAIIIWLVASKSITTTKTIKNISVRVINIPPGKTIDDIQPNGILNKKIELTLTGNKKFLDDLYQNDLEIVIDAENRNKDWIASITKKNIRPLNPEINILTNISKISHKELIIKLSKLITEKIPIIVTRPIGEPPKGYQFVDVWPYNLSITISGPENIIKRLKSKGLKLTFNLNDISKTQLDDIVINYNQENKDAVSFLVPNDWKKIYAPILSETPIEINDPDAKNLRIDFIRYEILQIDSKIPINIFFPTASDDLISPQKISISTNDTIQTKNGIKIINQTLFAKNVSELFLEIVKDMIEVVVIVDSKSENKQLNWVAQIINASKLENKYISTLISDSSSRKLENMQTEVREEYLRNRFRNYINRFRLFNSDNKKLNLKAELQGNAILIKDTTNEK